MIGRTVSHYRVLERLGSGGMGTVYLAEDTRLRRKVALKFLAENDAADPLARARLQREAEAASALDHPHVATIYEVGEIDGQLFIAMAYYAGETLRDRLARGPLPLSETVAIAEQVAGGLAAAHAAGIVHRDLKPANVILTPTGQVKILDFGLAKQVAEEVETRSALTSRGTTLGTLGYMSPEQARAEMVGPATDVWSFGVMLFEMLAGRRLFDGGSATAVLAELLTGPIPPVRSSRPDVPGELARVVERALVRDPRLRTLTAAEAARAMRELRVESAATARAGTPWYLRPKIAVPLVAGLVVVLGAGGLWARGVRNRQWARATALPEIERLTRAQQYAAAVDLARKAEAFLPGDGDLTAAWETIARPFTITTDPPGAAISFADYGATASWRPLATSPAERVRFPRGPVRVRIEKQGYETLEDVVGAVAWLKTAAYRLVPAGSAPPGMVRAQATVEPLSTFVFGLELPWVTLNAFWVDRAEVSNRDFKAFVDAGGYRDRRYWTDPIVREGRTLPWEEAMRSFVDATGRPGPAPWELGSHPNGQDDLPVRGVSWYEARAYAAWAGKSLPSIYHWSWVASLPLTGYVIPLGNFQSASPLPVTAGRAIHRFGAVDLAGNVKEWTVNDTGAGKRYILGGAWDEPRYMFADADARAPFDRAPNFGFRCVKYDAGDASVAAASATAAPPSRDYTLEKPVGDEVFEAFKRLFSYDRSELTATVDAVDESNPHWRREKVGFAAAYGAERVLAYVYLPRKGKPPFQTVFFMPGAGAWDERSSEAVAASPPFAFLLRSGRAVVFPLYKGTYERGSDAFKQNVSKATSLWRDYTVAFSKDLARTIDYIETRPDFDKQRFAYFGTSRGGSLAPVLLANEPRIKTAVLWIPGLYSEPMLPEVDPVNFLSRMTIPTLQLSGKYDYNFPDESSSRPFFARLAAPPDRKRRVVYDTGHNLPQNEAMKETLDWLDRELGPVLER